jgi:nucleotide-binding universal stress UspA family protein
MSIALAQETGQPLYFLYVVNLDFLARTTSTRTHTIDHEMEEMGEFILLEAQNRAAEMGVAAEGLVRHGDIGQVITGLCKELNAGYLVIGRPKLDEDEENVFTHARLENFANTIERQTGAKVIMPDKEE